MTDEPATEPQVEAPVRPVRQAVGPRWSVVPGSDRRRWPVDACLRYRVLHHRSLLRPLLGETPDALGDGPVLLQRPRLPALSQALARSGRPWLVDSDDLLWEDHLSWPWVRSGRMTPAASEERAHQRRAALIPARDVVVSTTALAEAVTLLPGQRRIAVVPNALDPAWVRHGQLTAQPWRPGQPRVIRYLAGNSHDADLRWIAPTLAVAMRRWSDLSLEVVGALSGLPPELAGLHARLRPAVAYDLLPALYSSAWVTIAPLERTWFNRCKTALKFLESAAFGTPCIATPIPDMQRCATGGVLLANTVDAWMDHLDSMRDDRLRMAVSQRGREWIATEAMAPQGTARLATILRGWGYPC